jgi:hypothetical protein
MLNKRNFFKAILGTVVGSIASPTTPAAAVVKPILKCRQGIDAGLYYCPYVPLVLVTGGKDSPVYNVKTRYGMINYDRRNS